MKLELMEDLYARELREALVAEERMLQLFPKLLQVAREEDLKYLIEKHAAESEQQAKELEKMLKKLGDPRGEGAIPSALAGELQAILQAEGEPDILDAALVFGAQKIEHNEIACYSSLQTMAQLLGLEQDAQTLGRILEQEQKMSEGLFALAESLEMELVETETE